MVTLQGVCVSSETPHDKQTQYACKTCGQGRHRGCPLIASHYSVERPDSSVLRGVCKQRGRATRRDGYRSVEDIITYS
jgi:hypothetical protein